MVESRVRSKPAARSPSRHRRSRSWWSTS